MVKIGIKFVTATINRLGNSLITYLITPIILGVVNFRNIYYLIVVCRCRQEKPRLFYFINLITQRL